MHVGVFVLLKNKTEKTYLDALTELLNHATKENYNLKPKEVVCDFELAAINATKQVFPGVEIKSCHFYFCQALKKILKLQSFKFFIFKV